MAHPAGSSAARRDHWDQVYASRGQRQVSWYQPDPRLSAALVTDAAASLPAGRDSAVIDAGGGASLLAQRLTNAGFTDVTVLDVSAAALAGRPRPPRQQPHPLGQRRPAGLEASPGLPDLA